ncbi:UPF0102 protein [Marinobacterium nitratireducens]|uniref:UPF0102 protein GCM10011348_24230 n=1 Tax=Marinobacterium nitratireducens TaxID=518897 RepID=A0A917ZGJ7_9GAMM|nr:YraN family protein [Marinobacterium nitratireducens]GGO82555.1 UPF0102 protein [Marinobacterium nitratireducens]
MDRQASGRAAEDRALQWLLQQGLRLIERNYRCRLGEIDLIMEDRDCLVFVEVRKRGHGSRVSAEASVDARKQQKLIHAANLYLSRYPRRASQPCRFDLIALASDSERATPLWYKDAFRP